jgi:hypothetical protein
MGRGGVAGEARDHMTRQLGTSDPQPVAHTDFDLVDPANTWAAQAGAAVEPARGLVGCQKSADL